MSNNDDLLFVERDESGLCVKSQFPDKDSVTAGFLKLILMSSAINQGPAWLTYLYGNRSLYDANIDILATHRLGWLYISLIVLYYTRTFTVVNTMIQRKEARVNLPDQYAYKVQMPAGKAELPYVTLENRGAVGRFNRAQRGYNNLMEYLPMYLAYFLLAGFVYPFPVFINTLLHAAGRVTYVLGYTRGVSQRMGGFALFGLAQGNLEALILIAGVKALLRA
eukprot:TRINITY_DN82235_c0_g1_i1.p1 TRINITY_DN82235_c0_g1~~TRINITY_DN82235_c0_g1_i1.p1  ORF type:complete len:222 (+),score=24.35 TRINITY_DN82235_c0_g1_i1:79-744(+)